MRINIEPFLLALFALLFATNVLASPDAPVVSNVRIVNATTASNVTATGQGATGTNGEGGFSFGGFSIGGSGGSYQAAQSGVAEVGVVYFIGGTQVSGGQITNATTASNIAADKANVRVGAVVFGPQ